jgi:glycosyltransferase involved in cell wall biosynthesis
LLERQKPMKIACTGKGWMPETTGGLDKYAYGLVHELTRQGDHVDYFVVGTPVAWDAHARTVSLAALDDSLPKRMLDARAQYAREYREPYDVCNIHFAMYALPLLPYISKRTPRVVNFQGPWSQESRFEGDNQFSVAIKHQLEKFVYHQADRFIVLSNAFGDLLSNSYGIQRSRITTIPMGIDCDFFVPADGRAKAREALGWPKDVFTVFTARRLVRRVGLVELIETAAIMKASGVSVAIRIAGKGPLAAELRDRIEQLNVGDIVELVGFVSEEELARCFQAADLTFLPTQSLEGFGTIISESLACGTPVAGTPIGGITEAIGAFAPQLICETAKPADMAALLLSIARGGRPLPAAADARAFAVETYAWPSVARRVREVFALAGQDRG